MSISWRTEAVVGYRKLLMAMWRHDSGYRDDHEWRNGVHLNDDWRPLHAARSRGVRHWWRHDADKGGIGTMSLSARAWRRRRDDRRRDIVARGRSWREHADSTGAGGGTRRLSTRLAEEATTLVSPRRTIGRDHYYECGGLNITVAMYDGNGQDTYAERVAHSRKRRVCQRSLRSWSSGLRSVITASQVMTSLRCS